MCYLRRSPQRRKRDPDPFLEENPLNLIATMASAVPAGTVEAEEQDEITLKYQRLLPNYLLTASPQLSALHFSCLHHSEPDFDRTTDLVRCPRCGHCFASTRVSTSRVGSRGSNFVEVADTLPTPGATITRTCNICNGRTIISTSHGTLGDGRARLQSVRGRLKGQRSTTPSAAPLNSVKKRTDSEREAAVSTSVPLF